MVGNARHVPMLAFHRNSFSGVQKWRRHQSIRYHLVVVVGTMGFCSAFLLLKIEEMIEMIHDSLTSTWFFQTGVNSKHHGGRIFMN